MSGATSQVLWWDEHDDRYHGADTKGARGLCSECDQPAVVSVGFVDPGGVEWVGAKCERHREGLGLTEETRRG